jgi:hypothetical protein
MFVCCRYPIQAASRALPRFPINLALMDAEPAWLVASLRQIKTRKAQ